VINRNRPKTFGFMPLFFEMVGTRKRWAVGGQNEIENHRTLDFTGFV